MPLFRGTNRSEEMTVTIVKVANGYLIKVANEHLIKPGDNVYVATTLKGYSYSDVSVDQVLKQIFEAEQK